MEHLSIDDYHFIISPVHQLEHLLTKPLSRTPDQFLTSKIGVVEPSPSRRGIREQYLVIIDHNIFLKNANMCANF